MIRLGVNIDHVATLRQARRGRVPDPVHAAAVCEAAGCDSIVCHLREDRRHIQDRDLRVLKETVTTRLNLEMGLADDIIAIALAVHPDQVTLVPERREELTTEGGLDVGSRTAPVADAVRSFHDAGIRVSLFIEADPGQIDAARETGADAVELHTGRYADAATEGEACGELGRIMEGAARAASLGLRVHAGHGLDYRNVAPVCRIAPIEELNIGYSIICRAIFSGLDAAVREMRHLIRTHEKETR